MYAIYYQGVIDVEKGTVIILYTLPELIKKHILRRGTPLSRVHVSSMTRWGVEPCCPAAMFQS